MMKKLPIKQGEENIQNSSVGEVDDRAINIEEM
jgi:hypothetical protein